MGTVIGQVTMGVSYWIVNKLGTVIGQVQVTYLGSVFGQGNKQVTVIGQVTYWGTGNSC